MRISAHTKGDAARSSTMTCRGQAGHERDDAEDGWGRRQRRSDDLCISEWSVHPFGCSGRIVIEKKLQKKINYRLPVWFVPLRHTVFLADGSDPGVICAVLHVRHPCVLCCVSTPAVRWTFFFFRAGSSLVYSSVVICGPRCLFFCRNITLPSIWIKVLFSWGGKNF
jgi:hypothetical protein